MSANSHPWRLAGWVAGILSTVIGGLLVAWLTQTSGSGAIDTTYPSQAAHNRPETSIDFTITDQLGEDQITEQVSVVIDGRSVGTLTVDVVHPTASLTVTVPTAGLYQYKLDSTTIYETDDGGGVKYTGTGNGQIQVSAGRSFALVGELVGDRTLAIALE